MAKKIIWTKKANEERKEILDYWIQRNQSKTYSIKLNKLIVETLTRLSVQPELGRKTDIENVRVKLVRDYLLFYEINKLDLIVLSIWDGRKNELNLKIK